MKPTFKTTALAILVSLGLTACAGNSNKELAPTSVNAGVNNQGNTGDQTNTGDQANTGNQTNTGNQDNTGKPDNAADQNNDLSNANSTDSSSIDKDRKSVSIRVNLNPEGRNLSLSEDDLNSISNGKVGTYSVEKELTVKGQPQKVDVILENKPYSAYGFLIAKEGNNTEPTRFKYIYAHKEGAPIKDAATSVYEKMIERGNATYVGNVYATVLKNVDESTTKAWTTPELDGVVEMNITVDRNNTIWNGGKITSKLLGGEIALWDAKVTLNTDGIQSSETARYSSGGYTYYGKYEVEYTSTEAKEMVGHINLRTSPSAPISEYKAVFGGTANK
ncbi:hypothetical protein [Actinobacillus porcinus]|uniref:hypothetical protein n=1 Tax=Actinobacillus porcinus TaxID=51048 RepID=UPI0023555470|nr:hypothetical protein [Actinobacillus porcinus]MCI5764791.1 hypothetical protein [Actinobacillus porcinus]MDY5422423.1 hypothetical protein [Actinobacillus porcinus]